MVTRMNSYHYLVETLLLFWARAKIIAETAQNWASPAGFAGGFLARGDGMATHLRVGLYARVSTHDQQTLPLQLDAMRAYVAQQGTDSSGGRADMTQSTGGGRRGRHRTCMRGRTIPGHRGWSLGFVAAVLLGLSWAGVGEGAPGDLDPTFGTGGIAVSFGPKDVVRAMVQQPDGKLVLAGTSFTTSMGFILLVRYLPDGQGDPTFGAGGKVTIPAGNGSSATALVLQADGKLVVASSATGEMSSPDAPPKRDLLLARISPDGQLDATFGSGGLLTTTVESNSAAFAVLQQPDGQLVVAGTSDPAPANHFTPTAFLVRYHVDGRVDASFGRRAR